jgi:hypothetical protein
VVERKSSQCLNTPCFLLFKTLFTSGSCSLFFFPPSRFQLSLKLLSAHDLFTRVAKHFLHSLFFIWPRVSQTQSFIPSLSLKSLLNFKASLSCAKRAQTTPHLFDSFSQSTLLLLAIVSTDITPILLHVTHILLITLVSCAAPSSDTNQSSHVNNSHSARHLCFKPKIICPSHIPLFTVKAILFL